MYEIVECVGCGLLVGSDKGDDIICNKCAENKDLRSLLLWSARRLSHKQHKDFAYTEYEKITGEKPERL